MTTLHASPYNIDATGFYFGSQEEYSDKSTSIKDRFGNQVDEFIIEFIDGEDAHLFEACEINQSNLYRWFEEVECLHPHEKTCLYFLLNAGYCLDEALGKLDEPCITECRLREAAEEVFDECYGNAIPENLRNYIDYDAFARDLEMGGDMVEFEFNNTTYTCTNAACI